MLDEIVSETSNALVPPQAGAPEVPAATAAEIKAQPGAAMFGAVPLREPEKFASDAAARSLSPDSIAPEIKIQPTEVRGRAPRKDMGAGEASTRQGTPLFVRILGYAARAVVVGGLCALAWAAGAYYSTGHSPFDLVKSARALEAPPTAGHDDVLNAMRQMSDEMHALKANVAQEAGQRVPVNNVPPVAGTTNADVIGRIDKLDAEVTAKLSQVDQQLASLEQQIAAAHTASVARAAAAHKHAKHLHDAFNPAQDPSAPGAPHPLDNWQH